MKIPVKGSLFFLSILLLLSACNSKNKSDALVKTWMLEDLHYTRAIPPQLQATVNNSVKEMKENVRLTYYADGTFRTKLKGSELHGTWKLNWNSTKITTTDDGGKSKEYNIDELSDNKFMFEATDDKDKVIYVMVPAK